MSHRKSHDFVSKRPLLYILKDGKPVLEQDMEIVGAFIADAKARNVGHTSLKAADGTGVCISTDFMCVAPFMSSDQTLLWETLISWPGNKKWDGWTTHYSSLEDASAGHKGVVDLVKALLNNKPAPRKKAKPRSSAKRV